MEKGGTQPRKKAIFINQDQMLDEALNTVSIDVDIVRIVVWIIMGTKMIISGPRRGPTGTKTAVSNVHRQQSKVFTKPLSVNYQEFMAAYRLEMKSRLWITFVCNQ